MALVLSGKEYAGKVRESIRERVSVMKPPVPGLAVVMVGNDPASSIYVSSKERACRQVGFNSRVLHLPGSSSEREVLDIINDLNNDSSIHGILVQLPVPDHISATLIASAVIPEKDVDGFHPVNVGRLWRGEDGLFPCTPSGIIGLLHHHSIPMAGKDAVIIGRSNIVGKPMAALLLRENCTVTIAHSRTVHLQEICSRADIVVAAVGRSCLITSEWIKTGAVVIDVGMNRDDSGKLTGDVDYHGVFEKCGAITPVPGGVGPLTIAFLLKNTLNARAALLSD
jgi:methylenetetrahydrofolate dehydrogenase (NADP+)/methenyltetrahydrofolate cyclohydrolase